MTITGPTIQRSTATNPVRVQIARIARRLAVPDLDPGARASLRRGDPATVLRQAACHRLLLALDEGALAGEGALRWATVVHAVAIGARPGATSVVRHDGDTLARAGYSEQRFARLLAARGSAFRDQVVLLARFLHSRDEPCAWLDLGELVLVEGLREQRAEWLRLRVARDYYRVLDRRAAD